MTLTEQTIAPVKINFGYEMDRAEVADAIQFDPPINGVLSWENNLTATFTPRGCLDEAAYPLSFTSVLTDTAGYALALPR
ncbi:MAG: hypothetical protein IPL78_21960 [Chloroflexi bacterium]|nr:hypothetical protein [Chloroflexota bacterium]